MASRSRIGKLQLDPVCEDCLAMKPERVTEAVDVHHKIKISERPDLRLELSNLMSLCKSCHSIRTARGE